MIPHGTQYWVNWILNYFWDHYIDTDYAYRMCFDCQWCINFKVMWIIECYWNIQDIHITIAKKLKMVVVTLI